MTPKSVQLAVVSSMLFRLKEVRQRDLTIKGVRRNFNISQCNKTAVITDTILNAAHSNAGSYACVIELNNGTLIQKEAHISIYNSKSWLPML